MFPTCEYSPKFNEDCPKFAQSFPHLGRLPWVVLSLEEIDNEYPE
jgi:hypothetical protein